MSRRLMEGSEAISEVLEGMARLLPPVGGVCINAESELEAVGMAWGAAAGGVRAATGSVGQGLSLMQESLSEACNARIPLVVLNMARGQGDYFQATRGGGHGDYRHIVLAPADGPEAIRLVQLAFHLADQWRNPVMVLGDYYLAHVQEAVDPSPIDFGACPSKDWALDGSSSGSGAAKILSPLTAAKRDTANPVSYGEHLARMGDRMKAMEKGVEPLIETGHTEDAELIVVAYGTPGRYVRYVVSRMRAAGVPVGFIRPITLWPFPTQAVAAAAAGARAVAVYELNTGQMFDDVRLAIRTVPVSFIGGISFDSSGFGIAPDLGVNSLTARVERALEDARRETA